MHERCHSGARTSSASPESRNTSQRSQWLNPCSWIPGPALTGCPGMTNEFFSTLLGPIYASSGYGQRTEPHHNAVDPPRHCVLAAIRYLPHS